MVDLEHSNNSTLATEDIPQLTINHIVAADLDSSNAFEGMLKRAFQLGHLLMEL